MRYPILALMLAGLAMLAGCGSGNSGPTASRGLTVTEKAAAPRRLALIIGNSRYRSGPLGNPVNDAALIDRTLRSLGFSTRLYTNRSQREMKAAIREFGEALAAAAPNAVGVFYYAGHGVQVNGRNYLIPIDADIHGDADVDIEAVSADTVLDQMRESHNRLNFLILDACRNNPFPRSSRAVSRGLAQMEAPAGVLIAYSTAPGEVAADGNGRNSPYSEALARAMTGNSAPAELMFKEARDEVMRVTSDKQTPWESSSLTGQNFYFATSAQPDQEARLAQAPAAAATSEAARRPVMRVADVDRPVSVPRAPADPEPANSAGGKAANAGRRIGELVTGFGKGVFNGGRDVVRSRSRSAGSLCQNAAGKAVECDQAGRE